MPSRRLRVGGTGTTVTPSLVASRSSGTAPLAVHFDATSTTSSAVGDAFRQVSYTFGYGDSGSGTWSTNSASKNSDSGGPIGAHVYETAGTYTVTVTADDGTSSASTTATVTVSDPDTVYSGTNTICIDTTGGTSGGPSGCSYSTSMPTIQSNRRYLIKRGQTISGFTVPRTVSGVRIGAYGSGAKPIVSGQININGTGRPTTAQWSEDIVLADLNPQEGIYHNQCGRNVLLLRCDMAQLSETSGYGAEANNTVEVGSALGFYAGINGGDSGRVLDTTDFYIPQYIFVVDCYQRGDYTTPRDQQAGTGLYPNNCLVGTADGFVSMGNDFLGAREHVHRLYLCRKSIIQHNKLQDRSVDGIRHAIKLHSGGLGAWTVGATLENTTGAAWVSYKNVIRDNSIGDASSANSFTVAIQPQNTIEVEGVEDTILEDNTFVNSATKLIDIQAGPARRTTTRGNTLTGGTLRIEDDGGRTFAEPIESDWRGPYYGQYTG